MYQVGTDGTIWSCSRLGPKKNRNRRGNFFQLKPRLDKDGYARVTLCRNGKTHSPTGIHAYVLTTFVGPCPVGYETCHKDGNPANNRLKNLRWGTKSSNNLDKRKHGTDQSGERSATRKLSLIEVRQIRQLKLPQVAIASKFGICRDTVMKIRNRTLWRNWE